MPYTTIQPPFTLKFDEMSKADLKAYFQWFLDVMPSRIRELSQAVRETPGFDRWTPDHTPDSLDTLGEWLANQIHTRPRTRDEREQLASGSPFPMEIRNEELTNRSFSLAMDVGMYLSRVLQENHPTLHWDQPLTSKRFVDYGQPVLVGFGKVPLNPVRIAITLAYAIASRAQGGKRLREIYDYWVTQIQRGSFGTSR